MFSLNFIRLLNPIFAAKTLEVLAALEDGIGAQEPNSLKLRGQWDTRNFDFWCFFLDCMGAKAWLISIVSFPTFGSALMPC